MSAPMREGRTRRGRAMIFGSSGIAEKWCLWLAEVQAPLSGAQMLARAKGTPQRLLLRR